MRFPLNSVRFYSIATQLFIYELMDTPYMLNRT